MVFKKIFGLVANIKKKNPNNSFLELWGPLAAWGLHLHWLQTVPALDKWGLYLPV